MKTRMINVHVNLEESSLRRLRLLSTIVKPGRERKDLGEMIREAIKEYLERKEGTQ